MLGAGVGIVFSMIFADRLIPGGLINVGSLFRLSLIGILGPLSLLAVMISCFSQRRILVLASGYAFCFGAVFVWGIRVFAMALGTTSVDLFTLALLCIMSLFIAFMGGAFALIVCAIVRTMFVVVLEQDGSLCPSCGYTLMPRDVPRCSECGTDPRQHQAGRGGVAQLIDVVYRRSRYITIIALIVAATMLLYQRLAVLGPMQDFRDHFMRGEPTYHFVHMLSDNYHQDHVTWSAQGHLQILADDPTRALLIIYAPGAWPPQPTMQIRVNWTLNAPAGFPTTSFDGLPEIMANLDRKQAKFVIKHGVPQTLINALLEATSEAGWPAQRPAPGPGGVITQTYTSTGPSRVVMVAAKSHFPADTREKRGASTRVMESSIRPTSTP